MYSLVKLSQHQIKFAYSWVYAHFVHHFSCLGKPGRDQYERRTAHKNTNSSHAANGSEREREHEKESSLIWPISSRGRRPRVGGSHVMRGSLRACAFVVRSIRSTCTNLSLSTSSPIDELPTLTHSAHVPSSASLRLIAN